ncbi:hypothetical protein H0H92_004408 [Tricholoma furcatifolium]|nr:hypothetical protein H0H92_004408 [Tricholoma furcatifolium]
MQKSKKENNVITPEFMAQLIVALELLGVTFSQTTDDFVVIPTAALSEDHNVSMSDIVPPCLKCRVRELRQEAPTVPNTRSSSPTGPQEFVAIEAQEDDRSGHTEPATSAAAVPTGVVAPQPSAAAVPTGVAALHPGVSVSVQTSTVAGPSTSAAFPPPAANALLANPDAWYIVTVGREVGVFQGWMTVQPLILGVSGGGCKRYPSQAAALAAFEAAVDLGLVQVRD